MSPEEWYFSLPIISRIWLTAAVTSGIGAKLGLIHPGQLAFLIPQIVNKFQIWRFFSSFLFMGMPSWNWLIQMMMMSQYAPALEQDCYPSGGGSRAGNSADFLFMLLTGMAFLLVVGGWALDIAYLGPALFMMVIYVWARRHPANQVRFLIFPPVPAVYLPWIMLGVSFIIGGDIISELLGIAAGHLFFLCVEELPAKKNWRFLHTPSFMYSLMKLPPTHAPAGVVHLRRAGAAPEPTPARGGAPARWQGGGHVLGR